MHIAAGVRVSLDPRILSQAGPSPCCNGVLLNRGFRLCSCCISCDVCVQFFKVGVATRRWVIMDEVVALDRKTNEATVLLSASYTPRV